MGFGGCSNPGFKPVFDYRGSFSGSGSAGRRVVADNRRILPGVRLDAGPRRLDLARALLYLAADRLEGRQDALGQGILPFRRFRLDLTLHRALPEGEVHDNLAPSLAGAAHRQPSRVVSPFFGAPLHPALPLVDDEVTLGVEGALTTRILQRRPYPAAGLSLRGRSPGGGTDDGWQIPREVVHVREPRKNLLGRGVYRLTLLVVL